MAYLNSKKERQKPKWTEEFRWKYVKDRELVKLMQDFIKELSMGWKRSSWKNEG
jgi:hypothetical protein